MLTFLLGIFSFAVLTQLSYIFFIFTRILRYKLIEHQAQLATLEARPVSVVVASHNALAELRQLVPILLEQQYPCYEVVVVNDRSQDDTRYWLRQQAKTNPLLKIVEVERIPEGVNPKKFALTMGIKAARYEHLLLTDADCEPESDRWIQLMSLPFEKEEVMFVLGYSPYQRKSGLLNWFIRFETFYTALQYISLALSGKPYMATGRNLAYRKSFFMANKGFSGHLRVTGGDDDLFVNKYANAHNTAVCIEKGSLVYSIPKQTLAGWFRQKKRHLSAGKFYKFSDRLRLALLNISHIFIWLSIPLIMTEALSGSEYKHIAMAVGAAILVRWVAMWIVYYTALRKLNQSLNLIALPVLDVLYAVYYLIIGSVALLSKKIKWN